MRPFSTTLKPALVSRINAARTESYQQLADSNNLPVDEVAKMAGQKLVARAQPGEYVKGINGKWLKVTSGNAYGIRPAKPRNAA